MIKDAFLDNLLDNSANLTLSERQFTQMEANFSLFWGLAIQLYEATLVSDQTPFDRFLGGDQTALNTQQRDRHEHLLRRRQVQRLPHRHRTHQRLGAAALFVTNIDNGLIDQMPVASGQRYDLRHRLQQHRGAADCGRYRQGRRHSPFTNPLTGLPIPLVVLRAWPNSRRSATCPFSIVSA